MDLEELAEIAARISAAERRAMAAERETTDRLIAFWLADRIGATFEGLLEVLLAAGCDVHLTISAAAQAVFKQELDLTVDLENFNPAMLHARHGRSSATASCRRSAPWPASPATRATCWAWAPASRASCIYYHYRDYLGAIASGSFLTDGMVVCPCSSGTLSAIVHGTSANLIHRAAEVHLKERRKLILVPRETPLSLSVLENMKRAAEAGAVILPAMPGFYHGVKLIGDLVDFVVGRICDQLGIANALIQRWGS